MICTELKGDILDADVPFWYLRLNDGTMVYQDDCINHDPQSAWERLCSYCDSSKQYIDQIWIRFRSNIVTLPTGKSGWWLKKGILAGITKDMQRRWPDQHFFIIGYVEDNVLKVTKWRLPELIDWEQEDREIPTELVIRKPNG